MVIKAKPKHTVKMGHVVPTHRRLPINAHPYGVDVAGTRFNAVMGHTHTHAHLLNKLGGEWHMDHDFNDDIHDLTDGGDASHLHEHIKSVGLLAFTSAMVVVAGPSTLPFCVSTAMNSHRLYNIIVSVVTPGQVGGLTEVQVRRVRNGVASNMLTNRVTLAPNLYTSKNGVVDTTHDDISEGDLLFIDVAAVNNVAPHGLSVNMTFVKE